MRAGQHTESQGGKHEDFRPTRNHYWYGSLDHRCRRTRFWPASTWSCRLFHFHATPDQSRCQQHESKRPCDPGTKSLLGQHPYRYGDRPGDLAITPTGGRTRIALQPWFNRKQPSDGGSSGSATACIVDIAAESLCKGRASIRRPEPERDWVETACDPRCPKFARNDWALQLSGRARQPRTIRVQPRVARSVPGAEEHGAGVCIQHARCSRRGRLRGWSDLSPGSSECGKSRDCESTTGISSRIRPANHRPTQERSLAEKSTQSERRSSGRVRSSG